MYQKIVEKFGTLAAGVFVLGFIAFIVVISAVIVPFYVLFVLVLKIFRLGPAHIDPKAVDDFRRVFEAMQADDISFLESRAAANPEFLNGQDDFIGRHWLTNAIDSGSIKAIRWFLDQAANPNYQDDEGLSPLKSAIQREDEHSASMVEMLLDAGADVNAPGTLDETPLHTAAARGSLELVQLLLDRGANPLAQDSEYGYEYPLAYAERRKHPDIIALLTEAMQRQRDVSSGSAPQT